MTVTDVEVQWASYSSLTTHRACPQRWFYSRVRGLQSLKEEPACERDFGSWWHMLRAAESLERGRALGSLKAVPSVLSSVDDERWTLPGKTATPGEVLVLVGQWWDEQSVEYREEWVARLGMEAPEHLTRSYQRWWVEWEAENTYEQPLAVELGWGRDLPDFTDPATGQVVSPRTRLVGYVDEVYRDVRRNVIVVRDHKSSKSLSTQTSADDMMDSQLQLYAWGAAPTVAEWGVGRISATAYDRMNMVAPRPPQLTLSGRLAMRNGEPSIGSCDLRTYVEWANGEGGEGVPYPGTKKDGSGAGFYTAEEAIIERLSTPAARSAWFQRTLVPLSTHVVRAHLQAAVDTAMDMQRSKARADIVGEASRNLSYGCRWCDYAKLCRAEMIGGPDGSYDLADFNLKDGRSGRPA